MNELPESWTTAPLDELLAAIVGGGTPSKSKASYFQGTIPFMTVKDMHVRFIEDTQDHITQEALDDSASTLIPADTLVVATRMSLGKIARPKVPVAINQDLKALFLNDGIDKTYMEYAWRSQESQIQAMGTGTTVKGIRLEDIRGLELAVAPSAEQTRIADQLDALIARVQACNDRFDTIPALLKRFRQTTIDSASSGLLTREWREDHKLPQWINSTIGKCGDVSGGLTKNSKRASLPLLKPYLRVANVQKNRLDLAEVSQIGLTESEYEKTKLRAGDLLIVEGNGSIDQVGRVAMWANELTDCVHQNHLIRWRTSGPLPSVVFRSV